jgi:hypothetical protein
MSDGARQVVAAALLVSPVLVVFFGAPLTPVLIGSAAASGCLLMRNRRKPVAP